MGARALQMKNRIVYQILTDRFAGPGGAELRKLPTRGKASPWRQYAGGCFDGISSRLDYLQELGVDALWISPIPENTCLPARSRKPRNDGYHGYWAKDFTRINEHFGSREQLKLLLAECKARDTKVILDVVLNHSNPVYSTHRGDLWRNGEPWASYYHDKAGHFHHLGDLDQSKPYDPYLWENANVWGLADFAQENVEMSEHLMDVHAEWLELGFSGVRLDTALHVPAPWIRKWRDSVLKRVPTCDYFVGEWWNGGPHNPVSARLARQSGLHLTDFGLAQLWRRWLCGEISIEEFGTRVDMQDDFEEPDLKLNFLDNHDMPRLLSLLAAAGVRGQAALNRLELGLLLLLIWRGVPCLYYGSEVPLVTLRRAPGKALGDDPYNRECMEFPHQTSPTFQTLRTFCRLRRETDLVEHPMKFRLLTPGKYELSRGVVKLEFRVDSRGRPEQASLRTLAGLVWERAL